MGLRLKDIEKEYRDFYVVNDCIFLDEYEFKRYLNTCDCEYVTWNFLLNYEDHLKFNSRDELQGDINDDDFDDMVDKFEDNVASLLDQYNISVKVVSNNSYEKVYKLSGTYGELKAFSKKYCGYIDLSNPGTHLADFEDEVTIDFDSGDDDYILGEV